MCVCEIYSGSEIKRIEIKCVYVRYTVREKGKRRIDRHPLRQRWEHTCRQRDRQIKDVVIISIKASRLELERQIQIMTYRKEREMEV